MGCCGQKRVLLRSPPSPNGSPAPVSTARQPAPARTLMPVIPPPAAPAPARSSGSTAPEEAVTLRYLERSPILVHGPATGRRYNFSAGSPLQTVDKRDAAVLMRTRFFRLN